MGKAVSHQSLGSRVNASWLLPKCQSLMLSYLPTIAQSALGDGRNEFSSAAFRPVHVTVGIFAGGTSSPEYVGLRIAAKIRNPLLTLTEERTSVSAYEQQQVQEGTYAMTSFKPWSRRFGFLIFLRASGFRSRMMSQ
jgi:hypothetical protein